MVEQDLIAPELKVELDWLWDMRNRMHLFQVEEHEWLSTDYTVENHNRATRSLKALTEALSAV